MAKRAAPGGRHGLPEAPTLFEAAVPEEPLFATALDRYFDGERDDQTLDLLGFA